MLKFLNTQVTFSEVPDEISLCIEISGCKFRCPGCHSPYLQEDIGEELTFKMLDELIKKNEGITCVCFMGDGGNIFDVSDFARHIKLVFGLKTALYTGFELNYFDYGDRCLINENFDYVKTGLYLEYLGPLTSKTTNQRMYKKISDNPIEFEDITKRFWK